MLGIDRLERELIEANAMLEHISGQLDSIARLLRLLVSQDTVEFEADEEAFEPDREALTA